MLNLDTEYFYAHRMNPVVLADMDLQFTELPNIPAKVRYLDLGDTLLINTWIGAYFDAGLPVPNECTLRFNCEMWRYIYGLINNRFPGTDLILDQYAAYYPFINYNRIHQEDVDEFVFAEKRKKILISNGPVHSNQCSYDGKMESIIQSVAGDNPDKVFIATHKFSTNHIGVDIDVHSNIKFTEDIINQAMTLGCDLNEISYLSNYCDLIIGRNSGPYCFAITDFNINNPNKTFYAFGERETDSFMYGLETPAKFIWEKFQSVQQVKNTISQLTEKVQ